MSVFPPLTANYSVKYLRGNLDNVKLFKGYSLFFTPTNSFCIPYFLFVQVQHSQIFNLSNDEGRHLLQAFQKPACCLVPENKFAHQSLCSSHARFTPRVGLRTLRLTSFHQSSVKMCTISILSLFFIRDQSLSCPILAYIFLLITILHGNEVS